MTRQDLTRPASFQNNDHHYNNHPDRLSRCEHYSTTFRSAIEQEAANDESKSSTGSTPWQAIRGFILSTNYRYTSSNSAIADFELGMRDPWHIFIQAARITHADDPAQDRLVSQLLYAHAMGTMRRTTANTEEEAISPEVSRIWTDLPYLAEHLRKAWEKSMEPSPTRRHNLAASTARLTALGVHDAGPSVCALSLLWAALETARPLARAENGDGVSVVEMLPACIAWFRYCNHKLLTLAVKNHVVPALEPHFSEPGELVQRAKRIATGASASQNGSSGAGDSKSSVVAERKKWPRKGGDAASAG